MVEFIGYFVIGGLVVSLASYFGSRGSGLFAAFVSQFPSITILVFILMYMRGGKENVISYAKSFVYVTPPWILYIGVMAFLSDQIGIWWSLGLGLTLYFSTSLVLMQLR